MIFIYYKNASNLLQLNDFLGVKACTYPGTTIGGTISAVKFYYPVGETVEFDCTEGYELQGSRMLHCLDTVKWSTSIPSCVLIKERNKK